MIKYEPEFIFFIMINEPIQVRKAKRSSYIN